MYPLLLLFSVAIIVLVDHLRPSRGKRVVSEKNRGKMTFSHRLNAGFAIEVSFAIEPVARA